VDRDHVTRWLAAYEDAWRAAGTEALDEIFAPDARYWQGPYEEPVRGLPAIARMWEAERAGPDEVFEMTTEIVAAEDVTAVVRAEVRYGNPVTQEWRDLWIIRFGPDGRSTSFEEWPFAPGAAV
jgi:ketosteroid isomerase-like protein